MSYAIGAKCYQCDKEWTIENVQYQCPFCQGNLGIVYDYDAIRRQCTHEYFANNRNFSIWRYEHLLPVANNNTIPLQIGWTPLYHIQHNLKPGSRSITVRFKVDIPKEKHGSPLVHPASVISSSEKTKEPIKFFIKDDGRNPSASFKDRAGAIALLHAKSIGAKKITGASTGNAGSSMACLCASTGTPLAIFVPEKAPPAKIAQLLIFGAQVFMVKGTYDEAFDLCLEVSKKFGWYNRNTGYNPYTREGKKTAAFEICEQLNWKAPDWLLVSVGDGNILSGIWKGFYELHKIGLIEKLPKMAGIQSDQSDAIYRSFEKYKDTGKLELITISATTIADSISVDLPRDGIAAAKAIIESNGTIITVTDEEILAAISHSGSKWGIFAEPAGAASLAGFFKMNKAEMFKPGETVVSVVTGSGLKDVSSAIKAAGKPIIIEPKLEAVQEIVLSTI